MQRESLSERNVRVILVSPERSSRVRLFNGEQMRGSDFASNVIDYTLLYRENLVAFVEEVLFLVACRVCLVREAALFDECFVALLKVFAAPSLCCLSEVLPVPRSLLSTPLHSVVCLVQHIIL